MKQLKTIDQVRLEFNYRGETVSGWARKNGFNHESVKKVLQGKSKCIYGEAHKIAVMLGIKDGEIIEC
jgi:gp16 family phage-associated protein